MNRELLKLALDALDDEIVLYCEEGGHIPGALINAVAALKSELAKPEPDCITCANRGRIDGLSQETHCEHCQWRKETWKTDHYVRKEQ